MPLSAGIHSYLLPESACGRLALAEEFWPAIHEYATLVDALPGYSPEMQGLRKIIRPSAAFR
jgi:hypothetical protein